jgi:benzoyl-CoA reductase subunit C
MISRFTEIYENRHALAQKWKQEGGKILGCAYSLAPEELIYAAGVIPVHLTESEETEAVSKGETMIPGFFCDYVQSVLAQAVEGVYDYLDGVVIPDACVPLRVLAEAWEMRINPPFFYHLNYPRHVTPGARLYFLEELRQLKRKIENFYGQEITEEALYKAIRVYNENRELLNRLYRLRLQDPPPISGSEILEVVKVGLVFPKEKHNQMLKELLEQLPERERTSYGKIRLMVSSISFEEVTGRHFNFLRIIEEMGGEIVCDDLIIGHRYFQELTLPKADLMEAMVDRYVGRVPVAFKMPEKKRAEMLLKEALRHKVKGIIFFLPQYCQSASLQMPYIQNEFKNKGIATLVLETTAGMSEPPLKTRLEAFLEMLA